MRPGRDARVSFVCARMYATITMYEKKFSILIEAEEGAEAAVDS